MVIHSFRRIVGAASQALLLVLAPAIALAEPAPAIEPALHHARVSVARAGAPIAIVASIDHPELVKSAFVVYRVGLGAEVHEVPFLRAALGPYVAVIPPEDVRAPSVEYA